MKEPIFGKERFPPKYQKAVGFKSCASYMHEISRDLVRAIKSAEIIERDNKEYKVFEIGVGSARNLHYIKEEFPNVRISGNDLFREACFEEMSDDTKDVIDFYEVDTLELFEDNNFQDIDLLMSSDHLMHLETEKVNKIVPLINDKWKPKYVLLKECSPAWEKKEHPRLYHGDAYQKLNERYDLIFESTFDGSGWHPNNLESPRFFLNIYQRKKDD